jgi:hypothetical protein
MAKRPRKMKNKHNFPVRRVNPITGEITMENQSHTVLVPPEPVTLLLNEDGVLRSKGLRGRGNSQTCSGSLCVYMQRNCFSHPVTGVTDFLYARAFLQSDAKKRECYGYVHECSWFPKLNDQKGGHDLLLAKIKENGGPIQITLRPIYRENSHFRVGKKSGVRPRRSPKHRGSHLRATVGSYGFDEAYTNQDK